MKPFLKALAIVALAASAVPALAEKSSKTQNVEGSEMDPKIMLCNAFETQTPPDQVSIAMQLKGELSGDAAIAAMSDEDLTAEIQKRCGPHPASTVYDVFTN